MTRPPRESHRERHREKLSVAARGQEIESFRVMALLARAKARARAGQRVYALAAGQPSFRAPQKVLEAAERALRDSNLGYTESIGTPELREAIAEHYRNEYGLDVPARRILVTTGSSAGFLASFLSAFDAGDRVVMPLPCYPCYRNILIGLGVRPIFLPTPLSEGCCPSIEALDRAVHEHAIRGLVLSSPSNPTGAMIKRDDLAEICAWAQRNAVRVISDEVYHGIVYEHKAETLARFLPEGVVVNSFSKYFCMTGWRVGWVVAPEDLCDAMERVLQHFYVAPPTLPQRAACVAFECHSSLREHVSYYRRNRDFLLSALPELGIDRMAPAEGGFYLYLDVSSFTNDSTQFAERMLEESGVVLVPGVDFDPLHGKSFLRLSFVADEQEIRGAIEALRAWLPRSKTESLRALRRTD